MALQDTIRKEYMETSAIKRKTSIIIGILVLIMIAIFSIIKLNLYSPIIHNSTYATGYVVNKYSEYIGNTEQNIVMMTFKTNDTMIVNNELLIVTNGDLWDIIEVDKAYFVNYVWDNNEIPVIIEMKINQEFMNIYDKNFNIK